eukprot:CAMPEP_0117655424 /NCGR_PEP_ID=MMETSP0804-20121206/4272_1 /TAXON_ID=1074897 /ORGANISM="Tetraselmis astigmatica, Strain CCMP880" /LENGTH=61 /DNA_ID=CAMNT_0005461775 /DNA_START=37 /DNA_END=222 /DNA_ORIENTATION=+
MSDEEENEMEGEEEDQEQVAPVTEVLRVQEPGEMYNMPIHALKLWFVPSATIGPLHPFHRF